MTLISSKIVLMFQKRKNKWPIFAKKCLPCYVMCILKLAINNCPFIYLGSFKFLLLELNIAFPVKLLCAPRYIAKTRFTDSVFTNWKWHPHYFHWNWSFVNVATAVWKIWCPGRARWLYVRIGQVSLAIFFKPQWLHLQNLCFSESSMDAFFNLRRQCTWS